MSFAMSPGYTKHNAQPPAGSLMGSASACEPMTTYAVERSERSTAARAGIAQTRGGPDLAAAADDREQRVCRQGRDDRYAWPSDSRVIEVAAVPRYSPCRCKT